MDQRVKVIRPKILCSVENPDSDVPRVVSVSHSYFTSCWNFIREQGGNRDYRYPISIVSDGIRSAIYTLDTHRQHIWVRK